MFHSSIPVPKSVPTVFLGGPRDENPWRDRFAAQLQDLGVSYHSPASIDCDWDPASPVLEDQCLRRARMILLPVLDSTLGFNAMGEIGFSILSVLDSIKVGRNREVIILIDRSCRPDLTLGSTVRNGVDHPEVASPALIGESNHMRYQMRRKVESETWRQGINLVENFDEMSLLMDRLLRCGHLFDECALQT